MNGADVDSAAEDEDDDDDEASKLHKALYSRIGVGCCYADTAI
jgi:hypothetical protein